MTNLEEGRGRGSVAGEQVSVPCLRAGPWRYDGHGMIWAPSLKGGETHVLDVRGWGYLIGGGHGALNLPSDVAMATQDAWGHAVAQAINAYFACRVRAGKPTPKGPPMNTLEKIKEAVAEAYVDQWARRSELGAEFDPHGAAVLAVLEALKHPDEGTVEAMINAVDEPVTAIECRWRLLGAINHIQKGEG